MSFKNLNNKTRIALAAVALLLAGLAVFALFGGHTEDKAPAKGNLLANADFADVTDGQPDGWTQGMWVTSPGASYLEAVTLDGGIRAVLIENAAPNDARYEQTVSVRENATYRLQAKVCAEGADDSMTGANLSFLGIYGTSRSVHDTEGKFEEITLYARTGEGQKDATVCLRLGGYGAENTGKAWFTDVSLEEVDVVPVGEEVLSIATPAPQKEKDEKTEADDKRRVIPGLFAVSAAYLALAAYIVAKLMHAQKRTLNEKRCIKPLAVGLAAATALRLALAAAVDGYGVDMGCFAAWGGKMASGGPANFYEPGYFCDYPPAYMLVLGAVAAVANLLGLPLGGAGHEFLLKLIPIACEAGVAVLLYAAARRELGEKNALGLALLSAFNPAFVIAGSCWGQIDAVLTVLMLAFLLLARAGVWQGAIPVFALAVLCKPQAGLLAPLGVAALVKEMLGGERKAAGKKIALGMLFGVLTTLAIALPFSPNQTSAFWLVEKYMETLGSYDYATLSTGNLMFLLGGNWTPNTAASPLGVSYGALGMTMMALSFAAGVAVFLRGKGRSRLIFASALTLQMLFCFGTKMHERYVLPAIVLLLLAYVDMRDVRLLLSAALVSAAAALNIGTVLAFEHLIAPNLWLGHLIGVLQLIACAATVWTAVSDALGFAPIKLPENMDTRTSAGDVQSAGEEAAVNAAQARMRREILEGRGYRLNLKRRDAAIMLLLTAAYAAAAFINLGEMRAPQSGYASSAKDESVVIDLGETRDNFAIYYYGGISDTQFSFAVSEDGVTYTDDVRAFFDRGECFKWQALRNPVLDADGTATGANGSMLRYTGRYLRVTFAGAGSALWEVAAVDETGNAYAPASAQSFGALEGRGSDPASLIDEQDAVPEKPTYMNSMYFDEIYHGRTGYEHANSLHTYETTHPPLGKVFMSWCIDLMGMTPFAWRFAGALTGVLMIPAMYLLAMQLMHSTKWAALCALLLSADCMHFTQTRIATIDSFPVLFMMLMFMFMARYMQISFYHQRLRDTFVPLALSGLFMGLAIASKWIGCYGAVGLALLFFARFIALWQQSIYAKKHQGEDPAFVRAANTFAKNGARTIAMCFVFFVFVPLIIYCLSYIPYLSAYGEVKWNLRTFERIWDAQVLMFDYHANLVAEHYFASPWYEWPLIIKPMWFYNADFAGAGMASSILTFGNPAVWWTGLLGIVMALLMSVRRNLLPMMGVVPGRIDEDDRALPVIVVGFLSAYLPWVLVSRLTFIYHYFASVPFIIIATALMLKYFERRHRKTAHAIAVVLGIAAVILFIAFYPLASGAEVPRAWCDAVAWFDSWMWY